jgi:hypothetical protein
MYFNIWRNAVLGQAGNTSPMSKEIALLLQQNLSFNYARAFGYACMGRKFGVTADGLMTLVPHGTQVGDEICVMLGIEKPFLLRHVDVDDKDIDDGRKRYVLVGDCYVHGIMSGEALRDDAIVQDFVIR